MDAILSDLILINVEEEETRVLDIQVQNLGRYTKWDIESDFKWHCCCICEYDLASK